MNEEIQIEPVGRRERPLAMQFLAGGNRRDLQIALKADALGEVLVRAGRAGQLWTARRRGQILAAAMVIPSPGRVGVVYYSPAEAPGVDPSALSAVLRSAADAALAERLVFAQAIIRTGWPRDVEALERGGFDRLAELAYMRRDLAGRIEPADLPHLTWQRCQPFDPDELGRVILATYECSLDCPALAGLRPIEDVLASHKASGIWRPDFWWIARLDGVAAGCVLVNDSASNPGDMDLVYMGVLAEYRGRGLGRAMVRHVCSEARRERRQFMHVVADTANPYAKRIYKSDGFRVDRTRLAFIRRTGSAEDKPRPSGC